MSDFTKDLVSEVLRIYRETDRRTAGLQSSSGLRCPPGCGICCESQKAEATVLEVLPLAEEIYRKREEEAVLRVVEERMSRGDLVCVMYRPGAIDSGAGRCSSYEFRPLVCRLFGFAGRRNKYGDVELSLCKIFKEKTPEAVCRAERAVAKGFAVPVYDESFMRIAVLDPEAGFQRVPINWALKQALGSLYWSRAA